ncbi:MAG TPA: HEPN domain-containing protein [Candidatus Nanoarchaeia archaeon]|nr:HEPN domain-containing protein [Candidatus Nanoarchaeia archaeon]
MSQAENKVKWCLNKAERELKEGDKHRGLVKTKPDAEKARKHLLKAEHFLKATIHLKKGDFADICTSTLFYSMYHCLLAIAAKFGYESRNQECTFALIYYLTEKKEIDFDENLLHEIFSLNPRESNEKTSIGIREQYQYETELSLKDKEVYGRLLELAKKVIDEAKDIVG